MFYSNSRRFRVVPALTLALFIGPGASYAEESCGNPKDSGGIGPFDYRNPAHHAVIFKDINVHHFRGREKKLGLAGVPDPMMPLDLDYTLRAVPNHHDALYIMGMYQLKLREQAEKSEAHRQTLKRMHHSAECYFKRAIMFQPDDANVYTTFGIFLFRKGDKDAAVKQLKKSVALKPDSMYTQYNLALLYFDMKKYDLARQHARKAYRLGYRRPHLKRKLQSVGAWNKGDNQK
jgi:tetratricopeptide (TPR) repeat protein